jgi:membrane-associated protein
MNYARFIVYNVVGGILWVAICLFGGYFFGNLPFVKENFSVVILAIIFISILPGVYEFVRHKADKRRRAAAALAPADAGK